MTPEEINEEVGEGVGRRGRVDGSGGALRAAEIRGSDSAVGGRVGLFLALTEQKDEQGYEPLAATSETLIYVAMTRLMVGRLARS